MSHTQTLCHCSPMHLVQSLNLLAYMPEPLVTGCARGSLDKACLSIVAQQAAVTGTQPRREVTMPATCAVAWQEQGACPISHCADE